jgi:hypothetical protein
LVWAISREVLIKKVGGDIEGVIAVPLSADCFAIACRAMLVTLCLRVRITLIAFSRSDEGSAKDPGDHLPEEHGLPGGARQQDRDRAVPPSCEVGRSFAG